MWIKQIITNCNILLKNRLAFLDTKPSIASSWITEKPLRPSDRIWWLSSLKNSSLLRLQSVCVIKVLKAVHDFQTNLRERVTSQAIPLDPARALCHPILSVLYSAMLRASPCSVSSSLGLWKVESTPMFFPTFSRVENLSRRAEVAAATTML